MSALEPQHVRTLQSVLLGEGKSTKYCRNIISGSFRAVIRMALEDRLLTVSQFPPRLQWPKWRPPEPDPFTPDERDRICAWFAGHRYKRRRQLHPSFAAYVATLFWTGLRPSEASGLEVQDYDAASGRLRVRQSCHLYELGEPKTHSAARWIELHPDTAKMILDTLPLHGTPTRPYS